MGQWVESTIGHLGVLSTSSVDKKIRKGESMVNLLNYMDVYKNNFIDSTIEFMKVSAPKSQINTSNVKIGDVFFTPSSETPDDIGYSAVCVDEIDDLLHSYHLVRLRFYENQEMNLKFKGYIFNYANVRRHFEKQCNGVTRYTLTIPVFENTPIYYPQSLTEQKKIATILSTLDDAIATTQALIDKHEAIKTGMMHDLFSRGIDPQTGELRPHPDQAPHLYKESELGLIPKEGEVERVDNRIEVVSGGTPSTRIEKYRGGDILRITPDDLSKISSSVIKNSARKITKEGLKSGATLVSQGSVVMSSRAPIGYCAIPSHDFSTNQGCKSFEIDESIDSYRLYYYINFIKSYFIRRAYGTTFLEISKSGIEEMLFGFPEIEEQKKIANKLKLMDLNIQQLQNKKQKLLLQKKGLMHDLLSGKVRVE